MYCRKRDPFQGPNRGSSLTLRNEFTHADKAKDFFGKRCPGREGKGTQENYSALWLEVSGFIVMRLVSWLSLASHLA